MERLDLLGKDELKKLYRRSALLYWAAAFYYLVAIFYAYIAKGLFEEYYNSRTCVYENEPSPVWIIAICGFAFLAIATLAIPYVMQHVRTNGGRIFLIFSNVLTMLFLLLTVIAALLRFDIFHVAEIIIAGVNIFILWQAFDKRLFGENSFSHKQLSFAWKKRKNNDDFELEDLLACPEAKPLVCSSLSRCGIFCGNFHMGICNSIAVGKFFNNTTTNCRQMSMG